MYKYKFSEKYSLHMSNEKDIKNVKKILFKNQYKYYKFLHPEWTHYSRDVEIDLLASSLLKDQKILEIGSGDGYIANVLKEKYGLKVIASDLEPRYPQYTEVKVVDGHSTLFQDKEYDVIISIHVLEHINDIDIAMKEFSRLLKDDGIMYHLVPSRATMLLNSIMQPLAYFRAIYLYCNGYFYSKFIPFKNKNILRFFYNMAKTLSPLNLIWGPGHGIYSRINCIKKWKVEEWKKVFEENNLEVIDIQSTEIAYSMHKIFPFKFLKLRKFLAKNGFGSANLFVLKKKHDI